MARTIQRELRDPIASAVLSQYIGVTDDDDVRQTTFYEDSRTVIQTIAWFK